MWSFLYTLHVYTMCHFLDILNKTTEGQDKTLSVFVISIAYFNTIRWENNVMATNSKKYDVKTEPICNTYIMCHANFRTGCYSLNGLRPKSNHTLHLQDSVSTGCKHWYLRITKGCTNSIFLTEKELVYRQCTILFVILRSANSKQIQTKHYSSFSSINQW